MYRTKEIIINNSIQYKIQIKRFNLWFNYKTKLHTFTHINKNLNPSHGAILRRKLILFNTQQEAQTHLTKLNKTIKFVYKNKHIIRVFDVDTLQNVYINKSNWRIHGFDICYEFADNMNTMQAKIDINITYNTTVFSLI